MDCTASKIYPLQILAGNLDWHSKMSIGYDHSFVALYLKIIIKYSPARWLRWLDLCFLHPKYCRLDSWSGHIHRLWVLSLVGVHTGGNQLMFLSCMDISPFSLSKKKSMKTYPQVRIKKKLKKKNIWSIFSYFPMV